MIEKVYTPEPGKQRSLSQTKEKGLMRRMGAFLRQNSTKNTVTDQYDMQQKLGKGKFAVVKLGVDRETGEKWAVKIVDKTAKDAKMSMLSREVGILEKIAHPNVIFMREIYDTPDKLYIVLELVTGGELFKQIVDRGSYNEKDAAVIVAQIAEGLRYLHSQGIVHRDLKPENLLFSTSEPDATIKVADFGLSNIIMDDEAMLKTACGTPTYAAPELLKGKGYGVEVDMWSLGVVVYIMLCGFPPFYHEDVQVLFRLIMAGKFKFPSPYWDDISDTAKNLILGLLTIDVSKRLTAEQVLQHPWVRDPANNKEDQMTTTLTSLRKFNHRRRFKQAILATIALNRLKESAENMVAK